MPQLSILAQDAGAYRRLIQEAGLPDLEWAESPAESEIVLGEPKRIREALPDLVRVRWIQSVYAGVEPLLDPTQRRDYILTNARGVFGDLMSEYVFGYLLFHEKKILQRMRAQEAGQWQRQESGVLRGKTIGLLGVGSIGAHLAETAKHFKMRVKGYTRRTETSPHVDHYYHGERLTAFAEGLDYLVSVLPRTADTNRIIDAEVLAALPPHAVLINVGRGNAVDEAALMNALQGDRLAAAVLDVFEQEPLPKDHPFWSTRNLYMTFHTSAISYPEDISKVFAENYERYITGRPLKHIVDFEKGY